MKQKSNTHGLAKNTPNRACFLKGKTISYDAIKKFYMYNLKIWLKTLESFVIKLYNAYVMFYVGAIWNVRSQLFTF